jgi:hypothetical protein
MIPDRQKSFAVETFILKIPWLRCACQSICLHLSAHISTHHISWILSRWMSNACRIRWWIKKISAFYDSLIYPYYLRGYLHSLP